MGSPAGDCQRGEAKVCWPGQDRPTPGGSLIRVGKKEETMSKNKGRVTGVPRGDTKELFIKKKGEASVWPRERGEARSMHLINSQGRA